MIRGRMPLILDSPTTYLGFVEKRKVLRFGG